jgi:cyclopropane fatty-acyl-phospholipid synthase-like methyltransferase
MPAFDNPLQTWTGRFARDGYLFGETPNSFLTREAHRITAGSAVLCVADGEGRNSVWLAEQGMRVTAFDFAANAVEKAWRLAERRHVSVEFNVADMYAWHWRENAFDAVVAIFIQFLPPEDRDALFDAMKATVRPGGLMLLQGYRPEQVDYGTGGPPRREHMYTRPWLESRFADWQILDLREYDAEIHEGTARHVGADRSGCPQAVVRWLPAFCRLIM